MVTILPKTWAFRSTDFCMVWYTTVRKTLSRATCYHPSSSVFNHNHVFMTNKMGVQGQFSQSGRFFVRGNFSTFNQGRLTKNSAASQESHEQEKYLQMPIVCLCCSSWCHDAGLFPRLEPAGSRHRVLRRAAVEDTIPSPLGLKGEAWPAMMTLSIGGETRLPTPGT